MKLVIGIVRPEKANDVLEALYRAEVRGISMKRSLMGLLIVTDRPNGPVAQWPDQLLR